MNLAILAAVAVSLVSPSAVAGDEYSFSEGAGRFYALRHRPADKEPHEEVVGSGIAMNRARRQAHKGGYELEIKGPFGGPREASSFIRSAWNPEFGKPRKPVYIVTPQPSPAAEEGEAAPQ